MKYFFAVMKQELLLAARIRAHYHTVDLKKIH